MHPRFLLLALLLACTALAAQPAPTSGQPAPQAEGRRNQKVELIRVEDDAVVIDEVRYAGQTQSITVKPKGNMPEYEIQPTDMARSRPGDHRDGLSSATGKRVWNLFEFLMAVFTEVSEKEAGELVRTLQLGELRELRGIHGGIENTNYFLTTDRRRVRADPVRAADVRAAAVLPAPDEAPGAARHSRARAPRAPSSASAVNPDGQLVHRVGGKPAAVVDKLRGKSELAPAPAHCAAVGAMLARMHLAARDFPLSQPNLRGLAWWNETVPVVLPHIDAGQAALLRSELAFQNHVAASSAWAALPRGPIHADLFRDNVMFEEGRLTGFFDFYFAGVDSWLFDIAVCLNDWCVDLASGAADAAARRRLAAGLCRRCGRWPPPSATAARDAARRRPALLDLAAVGLPPAARSHDAAGARPGALRAGAAPAGAAARRALTSAPETADQRRLR